MRYFTDPSMAIKEVQVLHLRNNPLGDLNFRALFCK